ncbi:MAG: trigger factor [Ignavibacteria bacterium]|nr:trigger factor [Ignavibacteria bacterium]
MERNLITLDGCKREVRIHITDADLKPHYEGAYKRAQTDVALPGFRKGKVPVNIIKQRMGREIENDALDAIADAEFRSFATEEKQRVVGNPALTDIQKAPDGITFTVQFEVMPEFELGDYRNLEINRPVRPVTEDDVQKEIDRICLRAATFEPAEVVDGSMYVVTYSMNELDRETSMPIIGAEAVEDRVFLDDDAVDMHLRNSMTDKKVGDSFSYVAETQDENTQPPNQRVTITDIQRVVPAEFNNEFAETITGGKFLTTELLREDIEGQIKAYFDQATKESMENQLVDQLVKAHDFEVPGSLVHAVIHQLFDDFKKRNEGAPGIEKMTAHDVEPQFKPSADRIVRWELIRHKVIEAEKLELNEGDIALAASKYGIDEDQMQMVMRQSENISEQLLAEKAIQALLEYAVVTDVTVDSEEPVI